MAILSILLTTIIIIVSILLILVVLVQRPKQEGLGAAFGGGAFDSALGAHTTDVLQKITSYLAVAFFVSAVGLAVVKAHQFSAQPTNVIEGAIPSTQPVTLDDAATTGNPISTSTPSLLTPGETPPAEATTPPSTEAATPTEAAPAPSTTPQPETPAAPAESTPPTGDGN